MELRQLRDFVTVVREGSFAAAARRLNMSQPGLGYQVRQLELDLGAPLLVRHSRGVDLTPAGATFLVDAERILGLVAEVRQKVRRLTGLNELRIGLSPTPEQLLGPALTTLRIGSEVVRVSFRGGLSTRLIQDVRSGLIDAAICIVPDPVPDLKVVPLYCEYLQLIGPKGEGEPDEVSFAELPNYRLTTGPRDHLPRKCIDEEAARRGIMLNIVQELEPGGLRRALVLHGSAHTVASRAMFVDEIDSGALAARRIVDPVVGLMIKMICAPGLLPEAEVALLASARERVAAHPGAAEWIGAV